MKKLRTRTGVRLCVIDQKDWFIVDLDSQAQWRTDSFTASIVIALMGDGTHAADLFTLLENKNFSKKKIQD